MVTEPQVWTIIGVGATAMFTMLTIISTFFVRIVRAEIGGLHGELTGQINGLRGEVKSEINGLRGEVTGEIGGLKGAIAEVRTELRGTNERIDRLDSDISALMRHTFGIDRPGT